MRTEAESGGMLDGTPTAGTEGDTTPPETTGAEGGGTGETATPAKVKAPRKPAKSKAAPKVKAAKVSKPKARAKAKAAPKGSKATKPARAAKSSKPKAPAKVKAASKPKGKSKAKAAAPLKDRRFFEGIKDHAPDRIVEAKTEARPLPLRKLRALREIIALLTKGPKSAKEIAEKIMVGRPTVYAWLRDLVALGCKITSAPSRGSKVGPNTELFTLDTGAKLPKALAEQE